MVAIHTVMFSRNGCVCVCVFLKSSYQKHAERSLWHVVAIHTVMFPRMVCVCFVSKVNRKIPREAGGMWCRRFILSCGREKGVVC